MKYIKKYESFKSSEDVVSDLLNYLKSKNFSPIEINKIIESYSGLIDNLLEKGENASSILKKIIGLLPGTLDGEFLQVNLPSSSWRNVTYM